jgi:hypothetical protein
MPENYDNIRAGIVELLKAARSAAARNVNPPIGLILCAEKGAAEAHYSLDNLPNKILAAEYQTILPDEKLIAQELERSRQRLETLPVSGARA